jgi:hypothetical protein
MFPLQGLPEGLRDEWYEVTQLAALELGVDLEIELGHLGEGEGPVCVWPAGEHYPSLAL